MSSCCHGKGPKSQLTNVVGLDVGLPAQTGRFGYLFFPSTQCTQQYKKLLVWYINAQKKEQVEHACCSCFLSFHALCRIWCRLLILFWLLCFSHIACIYSSTWTAPQPDSFPDKSTWWDKWNDVVNVIQSVSTHIIKKLNLKLFNGGVTLHLGLFFFILFDVIVFCIKLQLWSLVQVENSCT
jgi:hypothetical protein